MPAGSWTYRTRREKQSQSNIYLAILPMEFHSVNKIQEDQKESQGQNFREYLQVVVEKMVIKETVDVREGEENQKNKSKNFKNKNAAGQQ